MLTTENVRTSNNPLTTIIADTELLLMNTDKESPNYQSLTAISRAGNRAANVARRLLSVAKPVDNNAAQQQINVVDSLLGILSLLRAHIEREGIRIIIKIPDDDLPPVNAVKGQLDDIWINLLMNASDALRDRVKGEIGIEVNYIPDDSIIEVMVWDNGPGIPDDEIRQIFSPFFTSKPVGEGAGLGLHICREVVRNVGGSIECESIPNRMTRFTVTLPSLMHDRE
jgi:two-component system, NtrC family, sensor kinase